MDTGNTADHSGAVARDALADAAHVFLAAQQPVMVEGLRPRPAVTSATVTEPGVLALSLPAPTATPQALMSELDDLADL